MIAASTILSSEKLNLERIHFLLVDDNAQALNIVSQIITGFGAKRITKVQSVAQAKSAMEAHVFDFVLCDAQMPEADGYEFMRWLRSEGPESNRYVPAIILTGHTRRSQVLLARDCGAHFIIAKPLTPAILLERIFWVARDERHFIDSDTYRGPDRRFHDLGPPAGEPGRRADDDQTAPGAEAQNSSDAAEDSQ